MSPRSDARANRAALLASAAKLFADKGSGVALDAVARDAGVSIATLYRHFPNREELVAQTYRREIESLGEIDLDGRTGADAMRAWLARFVEYGRTKQALADVVHAGTRPSARGVVVDALDRLLAAGAADGSLRDDLGPEDVLALLAGLWTLPPGPRWPERAERLTTFVLDGLRAA